MLDAFETGGSSPPNFKTSTPHQLACFLVQLQHRDNPFDRKDSTTVAALRALVRRTRTGHASRPRRTGTLIAHQAKGRIELRVKPDEASRIAQMALPLIRACRTCREWFVRNGRKSYCTEACLHRARRERRRVPVLDRDDIDTAKVIAATWAKCVGCGVMIQRRAGKAKKWCSEPCRLRERRRQARRARRRVLNPTT